MVQFYLFTDSCREQSMSLAIGRSRSVPSASLRALTAPLSFHRVGARTAMWYAKFRDREQAMACTPRLRQQQSGTVVVR